MLENVNIWYPTTPEFRWHMKSFLMSWIICIHHALGYYDLLSIHLSCYFQWNFHPCVLIFNDFNKGVHIAYSHLNAIILWWLKQCQEKKLDICHAIYQNPDIELSLVTNGIEYCFLYGKGLVEEFECTNNLLYLHSNPEQLTYIWTI